MTRTLILVALLALPGSAFAQTVERTIDLTSLGWGNVQAIPVDTDANPYTEEWAIRGVDGFTHDPNAFSNRGLWRVVAVRNSGLCVGSWFDPRPTALHAVELVSIGGRAKLIVTTAFSAFGGDPDDGNPMYIVSLDTPQCK
jgi:hypothetical protein